MKRLGFIVNADKARAREALCRVAALASELGLCLYAEPETAALADVLVSWRLCTVEELAGRCDAIAVLGGDGTLLRAVHRLGKTDAVLMGLNIGSLGYLTGVEESRFAEAIRALAEDRITISVRQMLSCRIRRKGKELFEPAILRPALNEAVLSRGSGHLVRIALSLDGTPVTEYACDGLIISTPTGSTAYSLSAGGPLVMPGTEATIITVICPHALTSRPLVVSSSTRITLRLIASDTPLSLDIDGESSSLLHIGDEVEIVRHEQRARIAFLPDYNCYQTLNRKLGWSGIPEGISRR